MKNRRTKIIIISVASLLCASFFLIGKSVRAQQAQPQFLLSWNAGNSYAPSSYKGKILPGSQSQIVASLELVAGGQIINISNQSIYWYLDDTLIGGGVGVQRIAFYPFGSAPEMETLKVALPNYSGGYLVHQINIPVINPGVVIATPYPSDQFSGQNATATALAFFFNTPTENLSFTWSVNGQTGSNTENPDILQINLPNQAPSGSTIAISLNAQDKNTGQSASASKNLTYQKQLQ